MARGILPGVIALLTLVGFPAISSAERIVFGAGVFSGNPDSCDDDGNSGASLPLCS